MADPKTEQEPSIEEILQSIRQIISDDGAAKQAKPDDVMEISQDSADAKDVSVSQQPVDDMSDDVLELTDIVETNDGGGALSSDAEPTDQSGVLGSSDMNDKFASDLDLSAQQDAGGLLSDSAASAAASAMSRLLAGNVAVEREEVGRVGNVTLEDMARDLMRPLIKTWLDQNLPRIVEKLVAKELDKVSRRAMDR